ncbi:MAG: hypothetical protein ACRD4P_14895 [Bryobacteraceae bacterium]
MNPFLVALLLPSIFWTEGPKTAPTLRDAHIQRILAPASVTAQWKGVAGISVESADLTGTVKLPVPRVDYRINAASASQEPWIYSNGWHLMRQPSARFYYDVPGAAAALAAAEAFAYGVNAVIHTDSAGLMPLGEMLAFLAPLDRPQGPVLANIGFIDDGSPQSGELMNLLIRRNLLIRIVPQPDPQLNLTVRFGAGGYSKAEAADPNKLEHKIRADLTDSKRLLRIYGTSVVIGRLTGTPDRVRVHLLNYAARPVIGMRVRVLGEYHHHAMAASGISSASPIDYEIVRGGTEFTIDKLNTYAVIDLFQ